MNTTNHKLGMRPVRPSALPDKDAESAALVPAGVTELALHESQHACEIALNELTLSKQALLTLQASHAEERASLRSRHAKEVLQAENVILQLRQKFLAAQKESGFNRRELLAQQKQEALARRQEREETRAFEAEFKAARREKVLALKKRLKDLQDVRSQIESLSADWDATFHGKLSYEERFAQLDSDHLNFYDEYKLPSEWPDAFCSRIRVRIAGQLAQTKKLLRQEEAGADADSLLQKLHLPPIFEDPAEAKAPRPKAFKTLEHLSKPVTPGATYSE